MPGKVVQWLMGELQALKTDLRGTSRNGLVLALDQGGHASRAIVFDAAGRELTRAHAPIATHRSAEDRVEHDAGEILESLRIAIADVCSSLGEGLGELVAAGLATQRSSVVAWNRQTGRALSRVLSWQDRRNAEWLERLADRAPAIREITGLVLTPHYGASKLRWLLDHEPQVAEALERRELMMGPLASYLLDGLLTARPGAVDPANASRTQLWDYRSGDWSDPLLDWFGIPRESLPQCVPTRYEFGLLDLGRRSVPLLVCTGDQSAAVFASGTIPSGMVHLNIGTGAFLLAPLETPADAGRLLASVLYAERGRTRFALEGTVNGAGSALDWIDEQVGLDAHRAALSLAPERIETAEPPLFVNGVSGVGSPFWLSRLESGFEGQGDETDQIAAVLESIAFLIAENVAEMRRARVAVSDALASGGLASSDYLCQCIATACGVELTRSDVREATARGLAWLVAGEPAGWASATRSRHFLPSRSSRLLERYSRWQELMRRRLQQP